MGAVHQKSVQLARQLFLLLMSLIAEDVCVWIKTLSPAIWVSLMCPSFGGSGGFHADGGLRGGEREGAGRGSGFTQISR